jgi:hypothetical protein
MRILAASSFLCCLGLGGCYQSAGGHSDGRTEAIFPDGFPDSAADTSLDILPDGGWDPLPPPDADLVPDFPVDDGQDFPWDFPADASNGVLVPEGPGTIFEPESGEYITSESCDGRRCAAFSGEIYEVVMQENTPWDEDSEFVGVYRLAPGGTVLGTSWIDTTPDRSDYRTQLCWTGQVFLVVLPTPDEGLRVLSVDASGALVRPVQTIATDNEATVLCPSEGPFIVERGLLIHLVRADGSLEGVQIEASTPMGNLCVEAGAEAACLAERGITFLRRDGTCRQSDEIAEFLDDSFSCDMAYTGSGIALVWSEYGEDPGKNYIFYTLWDMDGRVVVPPRPVARAMYHLRAGSSGSTIMVFGGGGFDPSSPKVLLLAMDGTLLDGPMPAAEGYDITFWGALGIFWEGDAYALLWNTWPDEYILYRRFLVVE